MFVSMVVVPRILYMRPKSQISNSAHIMKPKINCSLLIYKYLVNLYVLINFGTMFILFVTPPRLRFCWKFGPRRSFLRKYESDIKNTKYESDIIFSISCSIKICAYFYPKMPTFNGAKSEAHNHSVSKNLSWGCFWIALNMNLIFVYTKICGNFANIKKKIRHFFGVRDGTTLVQECPKFNYS